MAALYSISEWTGSAMPVTCETNPVRNATPPVPGMKLSRVTASVGGIAWIGSRAFHPPIGAGMVASRETGLRGREAIGYLRDLVVDSIFAVGSLLRDVNMQNPLGRVTDDLFNRISRDPSTVYSYSQFGEDIILEFYLGRRAPGFFVDVGAYHPRRCSNTFLLYLRGWRGINIDADPDVISLFNAERPQDQNVLAAISGTSGTGTLIRFNEKAFNTLSPALAERATRHPAWKIQDTVTVTTHRLSDILHRHVPDGQRIDVMNVDIEGADLDALQGNDWDRFSPEFLIAEDHAFEAANPHRSDIFQFLSEKGYVLISHAVYSLIFRRGQPSISRQG